MLKIEKTVLPSPEQWEIIIEGMRNPMNSWDMSDSYSTHIEDPETMQTADFEFFLGEVDHKLMMNLAKAGSDHAKYRRMIPVWFTAVAPTFWWIEFDTYKIGTVRNSCSKMHKIHVEPFTLDNFSHEACSQVPAAMAHLVSAVDVLESLRQAFNETQDRRLWRAMIELLPHGYNMRATISLNYEVLANIYRSRKGHKLDEWRTFCDWVESLPYSELITGGEGDEFYAQAHSAEE